MALSTCSPRIALSNFEMHLSATPEGPCSRVAGFWLLMNGSRGNCSWQLGCKLEIWKAFLSADLQILPFGPACTVVVQ